MSTLAQASPKKSAPKVKKAAAKKTPASHPPFNEMVADGIKTLGEKGGSSRIALMKYIYTKYEVGDNKTMINSHLKKALKSGVKLGKLKQIKGVGANGSFKLVTDAKSHKSSEKENKAKTDKKEKPKTTKIKKAGKVSKPKSPSKKKISLKSKSESNKKKVTKKAPATSPKPKKPVKKATPSKKK